MKPSYQDALAFFGMGGAHPGGLALTKRVLGMEQLSGKEKVLDAGCGTGQTAAFIAKSFKCQVTAIDRHPLMIGQAKKRFAQEGLAVNALRENIENLSFADNSFDYIIAESVIIFTSIEKSLKEIKRVLKPGGIFLDLEMTAEEPLNPQEKNQIQSVYSIKRLLTEGEWLQTYTSEGFQSPRTVAANSIYTEIINSPWDQQPEIANPHLVNPKYEHILIEHQKLLAIYAERLGYRVYRMQK
ncbi:MAG: methyltransferase domain-containing protein [Bacillota bacterium]